MSTPDKWGWVKGYGPEQNLDNGSVGYNQILRAFSNYALVHGKTVYYRDRGGSLMAGFTMSGLLDEIQKVAGHVATTREEKAVCPDYISRTCIGEEMVLEIYGDGSPTAQVYFASTNKEIADSLFEFLAARIGPAKSEGCVYVLAIENGGPKLKSIGFAAEHLERGNYSPDVLQGFDHVVSDYQSNTPCGRIAIFDGPPGSGKTFLVRALLDLVPNSMMVILPPNLIQELSGPSLMSLMIDHRRGKLPQAVPSGPPGRGVEVDLGPANPVVFILEDADQVLVPRGPDNISSISSMLNLTDGILGRLMDIRIVATTNAAHTDFEEAIMRPGRLCRQVTVGRLSPEQSASVLLRLTGAMGVNELVTRYGFERNRSYSLAELYHAAQQGQVPEGKEKSRMGFGQ